MGLFSSKKENVIQAHVMAVDIATDFVRVSLVRTKFDTSLRKPEIVAYAEAPISAASFGNANAFTSAMLGALRNALSVVVHKNQISPEAIHCFLHSPWVGSQTRMAKMSKETPFVFTEKIASEILEKEKENFLADVDEDKSMTVIQEQIMSIKHNGYDITQPFGRKINSIETSIFIAFSDKFLIKQIKSAVWDVILGKPILFHSAHFSSFVAVRDIKSDKDNFLLLSVGNLTSHLSFVSNGYLHSHGSFPYGTYKLYEDISETLGRDREEVTSLIALHSAGNADVSIESLLNHSNRKAGVAWNQNFTEVLGQISSTVNIPTTVYLLSGKEIHNPLVSALFKNTNQTYALSGKNFDAIIVDVKHVVPYVNWSVNSPKDVNTMLHSLFISRRLSL